MESLSSVLLEGRWGQDDVLSAGHGFEERVRDTPSYSLSLGELWWRGQTLAGRIGIGRHVKKMSCCTVRSKFDVGLGLVLNPLVYTGIYVFAFLPSHHQDFLRVGGGEKL